MTSPAVLYVDDEQKWISIPDDKLHKRLIETELTTFLQLSPNKKNRSVSLKR